MVNCLVIRDVQEINQLGAVRNKEEKADGQHAIGCQGDYGIVEYPHEQEGRDEEETQLDDEEVEAVV